VSCFIAAAEHVIRQSEKNGRFANRLQEQDFGRHLFRSRESDANQMSAIDIQAQASLLALHLPFDVSTEVVFAIGLALALGEMPFELASIGPSDFPRFGAVYQNAS
jgi:hypothetical protein